MCKDCNRSGINARTGEPRKRCKQRVEFQLNYQDETCKEMHRKMKAVLPDLKKKNELELTIVDKGRFIVIQADITKIYEEAF